VKAQTGEREVLGFDVGPSEDGAFWTSFLRSLVARGLCGVRLVTSDAHRGLKSAVAAVLVGASWQRCRVHFMRNALSLVPKAAQQMVGFTPSW
jgi:putative transposase